MRNDIPTINEPKNPEMDLAEAESPRRHPRMKSTWAWLARQIERILDAKVVGVPVEIAVKAVKVAECPPAFATRAEVAAYKAWLRKRSW